MKYLGSPPTHDDRNTLRLLAASPKVNSYPMLQAVLKDVEAQYQHYVEVNGNACKMRQPLKLLDKLSAALRTHYESKPLDLKIIDDIRNELSPDVCPMCGSQKASQVDHVVPKDTYPEYSFFTRNLVPACECNGFKRLAFIGEHEGERVLHPYYDKVMEERLVQILFLNDLDAPDVELRVHPKHQNDPAVNFHVDKILRKTRIITWARKKWAAIRRAPESVFPLIRALTSPLNEERVSKVIGMHVQAKNEECGTPNNWDSLIYMGVLDSPGAVEYVTFRANGLRSNLLQPD